MTNANPQIVPAPTETRDAVVEVKSVTAGYVTGVNILNACSLTAYDGELIGIIGPNGAGKSTLLKAIFGLVKVRDGEILLRGNNITNLKANKLVAQGVGFVPQNNNVFPTLTIRENLEMGIFQKPKGLIERLEFVTEIFPELSKRMSQRAGSLSGGERQMVAMSRALMMGPHVLLLDEPLALPVRASSGVRDHLGRRFCVCVCAGERMPRLALQDRLTYTQKGPGRSRGPSDRSVERERWS